MNDVLTGTPPHYQIVIILQILIVGSLEVNFIPYSGHNLNWPAKNSQGHMVIIASVAPLKWWLLTINHQIFQSAKF